nr:PREDICTED: uncharacterized protein C7orf50 homolog isoform X2 [Megachile rotundata]XP_012152607.1 PREDICTED: uncharacterized protein C7orf50 homolog isoform X2 [Megachile rotundata]
MGSEDTLKFEVNEQRIKHKKLKKTKRKLNNSDCNDNSEEVTNCKEEKNINNKKTKKIDNEEELDNQTMSSRKKLNSNETEDLGEINETDSKTSKEPSKRQLKKEKAQIKENEKKMAIKKKAMKKGLNYVSKWKHARNEWKFEKLRQIWLMDNLLDQTSIPDDIFPTVLEYFEGCKGMAREQLLKKGMDVIRTIEENEENKDKVESVAYQRARKLLQALPTES